MKTVAHNAIVLAAGGSTRLGRPKQLLRRDEETLVHRAVRLALATQPLRTLVICGGNAEDVSAAIADLPMEIVFNRDWREGLASSLRLAAAALADDERPALIVGCDQPALEHDHLQRLLEGATGSSSGCAASLHGDAPGIPVVVSASLLRGAGVLEGDRGLRGLLHALPADSLYLLEAAELEFDLDTPGDVEEAMRRGLIDPFQVAS